MPNVRLNPTFLEFRGALGNMLFRKQFGKIFASLKPDMSNIEPSPAQVMRRQRFREAVAYGKTVMADAAVRALYVQAGKEKEKRAFSLMVGDYLNAPSIKKVDLTTYNGKANDIIKIQASDDFGLVSVHVAITNSQSGAPLESGNATESGNGSGLWLYSATTGLSAGTNMNVKVVATDRPGGTSVNTQMKSV